MTRGGGQDGLLATELAVVTPALLLLVMLAVQFGLWAHATQLADAAATQAALAASLPDGTETHGEDAAAGLLAQAGNLGDPTVAVERGEELVLVTVTGRAPRLVPGFSWGVSAQAAAPVERFIPEGQR